LSGVELTFEAGSGWSYLLVFLAAATPVLEVLIVIPAAVVAGMPPLPVALIALAGNLTTVVVAVIGGDRLLTWWRDRRPDRATAPGRRSERARRTAQRWGVPGLAFLAPATTGTHIAALAALAVGASRQRVLRWMAAGLAVWAAGAAAATALGLQVFV
jgi:Ca2+/H+ antiporter, TMEM165/GDT1 family